MGEVWRARDPRLGRDVAIKVLPERLVGDADALSRFEREAKAVAALSHPNVLGIFDLASDGGATYAVMELLVGESLRQRLAEGPFPQRKALEYALQTAQGLAAAHGRDRASPRARSHVGAAQGEHGPAFLLRRAVRQGPGRAARDQETRSGAPNGPLGYRTRL